MTWLETLQKLRDLLMKARVADQVYIGGYAPSAVRPANRGKGIIYLLRESEQPSTDDLITNTDINIYLDAWTRCESNNLEDAYKHMASIEKDIERVLYQMRDDVDFIGDSQLLDMTITEKVGDLDSLRPNIGVRFSITFETFKNKGD